MLGPLVPTGNTPPKNQSYRGVPSQKVSPERAVAPGNSSSLNWASCLPPLGTSPPYLGLSCSPTILIQVRITAAVKVVESGLAGLLYRLPIIHQNLGRAHFIPPLTHLSLAIGHLPQHSTRLPGYSHGLDPLLGKSLPSKTQSARGCSSR
jgi:hypothetical protein